MRILLDTNIFIYREDDQVIPEEIRELMNSLNNQEVDVLIHPRSTEDIEKNGDGKRKERMLSKLETYETLKKPPDSQEDSEFLNSVGKPENHNEKIDNDILYSVYRDAVDFLVTEDGGIHAKAEELDLEDRVLYPTDATDLLDRRFEKKDISKPPALKKDYMYNIDIDDPFFDSLKEDYEFEEWFKDKSAEGRECWIHRHIDNSIGALLIYKGEEESIGIDPPLPAKKRMKLCTFKVAHHGRKIGELFIRLAVEYALSNNLKEVYLTYFTKEDETDHLVKLIEEYGFRKKSTNERGEDIYVKDLFPDKEKLKNLNAPEISKKYWPSLMDSEEVSKYVIPIKPVYHDRLFTSYGKRQLRLSEIGDFIPEGNTIKKAYLSHSKIKGINPGDIVLFYRSHDKQKLTTLGVVEKVRNDLQDPEEIQRIVGRRTVYSKSELEKMAEKPTKVILFRYHFHLSNPLTLNELIEKNILNAAPQSIMEIDHEEYQGVKRKGELDDRLTIN